jgi:hypothetical protein
MLREDADDRCSISTFGGTSPVGDGSVAIVLDVEGNKRGGHFAFFSSMRT